MGLFLFLTIFSLLYSLLHAYAFTRAKHALAFGFPASILIVVFMLIMVLCPAIVRVAESYGLEVAGKVLAYIGYIWMGLLFLFVCASLVMDSYRLLIYLLRIITHQELSRISLSGQMAFFISASVSVCIAAYGLHQVFDIRTEHVTLKTTRIPEGTGKIRIVQITDVHLGLIVGEARLERILQAVKEADPDILVSTGDLVDGQPDNLRVLGKMLQEIQPRYGKFAVLGNHEYYAGLSRSLNFTKEAGFTMFRGSGANVADLITIAGVDDPAGESYHLAIEVKEKELLAGYPRNRFTILLKHRPVVDKDAIGLFDLQLSGHLHKGQVFPFVFAVRIFFPYISGLYDFKSGSYLYVSRGSGTWGPPIRFLSPPEVTVIDLVREERNL
jgi:predicted MPP superfamily phosphohydrolase